MRKKSYLLSAASVAVLAGISTNACAQESTTAITGGGSSSSEFEYFNEFATFNNGQPQGDATFDNPSPATGNFVLYWPSSGSGQTAFLNDDNSCNANKVLNLNGKNCSGTVGGAESVSYAASDSVLTSTQIASWASSTVGQSQAGNLIQIPSLGVGEAVPIVNGNVTANGQAVLTDSDLCGIFSGKITDWSQTSDAKTLAPGAITVVYRSDTSGATFLFLNHLSAVCTAANSNFTQPIVPTTTFVAALPGGTAPANFVGESGTSAVANYLANQGGVAVTSAIGYLSPDYTTINPHSSAVLANGQPSTLLVAAIKATGSKTAYLPNVASIALGLNNPKQGTSLKPPKTASQASDPSAYVPVIQTVKKGYPIVGYTTFDLAQCYASSMIATGIIAYLNQHYAATGPDATSQANNGFVGIGKSGAKTFATVITNNILTNKSKFNDNIQNATACAGLVGR